MGYDVDAFNTKTDWSGEVRRNFGSSSIHLFLAALNRKKLDVGYGHGIKRPKITKAELENAMNIISGPLWEKLTEGNESDRQEYLNFVQGCLDNLINDKYIFISFS